MKIKLGMGIGGGRFHHRSAFNELACSPNVLLELLEQRMGVSARRPSLAQRVSAYRTALERHLESHDAFYATSFERDPFAVAKTLLEWRDCLLMLGMDFEGGELNCERIDCLIQVDTPFAAECKSSEAERIRGVLLHIGEENAGVEELIVVDPEHEWPQMWNLLLNKLGARYCPPAFEPAGDTDLGRFQLALLENRASIGYENDGTIEFVAGYSEAVLAHAAAQRIADAGDSSALVEGPNLHLVDEALTRLDQPVSGAPSQSRSRPIPQLLNLVLQMRWLPFDPQRLLDFLVHPECPVDRRLRSELAEAVAAEPGMGGPAWKNAIERTREHCSERHADEPDVRKTRLARIDADLQTWLAPPDLETGGANSRALAEAAEQLGEWANRRAQLTGDEAPMYHSLGSLCAEFAGIVRDQSTITQAGVERLLRQLTGGGIPVADRPAELGHAPAAAVAGFVEPVDSVLWWSFSEPESATLHPWTAEELEALGRRGAHPPSAEFLARQEAERQLRPVLAARKKLVLFKPDQRDGEELAEHPLWTRLRAATREQAILPALLNVDDQLTLPRENAAVRLEELGARKLPSLKRWQQLPAGIRVPSRETESFSSLKTLVYSPFEWVCTYAAKLRPGSLARSRLTVDARLKGQLVHRLVELMFPASGPTFAWREGSDADLDAWMTGHWQGLLEEEGALLLLPGCQSDAAGLKIMARRTLQNLLRTLRRHDAREIVADHTPVPLKFGDGELQGDIDLCYETGKGESVVVDLKFGGYDDREAEVRDNTALQLAVYGFLMSSGSLDPPPKSAFYILTRRAWITGDGDFFGTRAVDEGKFGAPDMRTCCSQFLDVWQWRRDQLDAARLEITFTGTEPDANSAPPHEAWGPVENDGRYSDHMKLAGWKEGS